ncbi:pyrroline-5-carboxylate reductase [Bifidobacterium sp.]|jgi:pyrroline-5-carboxylate reductase|uniref:pyrroline-5-carboxylate reductase n=1 Tax=Bifidobacterium sp. TaxID=41200 RepID=UPI0025BB8805|nr:pyrroline-5-carboxylate reductase [Bifidobacterium sp.]MCH4160467.1 pyrroline-5-carboxylate reductase [Bifidobacterium sp.]MCH4174512.1 pyrroline-5-carboxylate reductase [Bifidobacterium sp.]MCI1635924.1 pyrroline-5-carboxylate reductase [Bifidobacterium sp.]
MELSSLTVGFIGYGNMAQAIAQGLVDAGVIRGNQIVACAGHFDKLQSATQSLGANPLHSAAEVAAAADVVIIAVKPYLVEKLCKPIAAELADDSTVVVSIAAGFTLERFQEFLPQQAHVVCTIPNTPIAIGQGVLVTESSDTLTDNQRELFHSLFANIALIETVDSSQLSIGGTIAGCGPAYAAMFIEALADAGVKHGLSRGSAYRLAAKMVQGTGALNIATGTIPAAMKDAVCSPGGTTIKGVAALERHAFRGAIIDAIDAVEGK